MTICPTTLYLRVMKWHFMNSNLKRPRYIYHKPQFTASLPHLFLKERSLQLLERQEAEDFDMVFFFLIPEINAYCGVREVMEESSKQR